MATSNDGLTKLRFRVHFQALRLVDTLKVCRSNETGQRQHNTLSMRAKCVCMRVGMENCVNDVPISMLESTCETFTHFHTSTLSPHFRCGKLGRMCTDRERMYVPFPSPLFPENQKRSRSFGLYDGKTSCPLSGKHAPRRRLSC